MTSKTNTLFFRTPEGIVFAQLLASPVTRFLAWSLDLVCIVATVSLLNVGLTVLRALSPTIAQALSILFYFVISVGYAMTAEWFWRGQTIGKKILRLRVVDAQGLRLQFSQIAIRNLLRAVDILPGLYLVGGLTALLTRRGQRLGDLAANTVVIRSPLITQPDLEQLLAGKFNSLRDHPHLAGRLRQLVPPAAAAVALQAVMRRDELEPVARVALFAEIADYFKSLVRFPEETMLGITDEQYVRNVVDVLNRARL